jgi:hypothetical protein
MKRASASWIGTISAVSSSVLRNAGTNFQSRAIAWKLPSVNPSAFVKASSATCAKGTRKKATRNAAAGRSRR